MGSLPSGLVDLQPYHLQEIMDLESLILQYATNDFDQPTRKEILRRFLNWALEKKCVSKGWECENGKLIAYFFLVTDPELIQTFFHPREMKLSHCAYLAQIVVHPEHQGSGVGSYLMDYIESQAKASGKDNLLLEVHSQSKAYPWYQNRDYKEVCSQVFMNKKL